MKNEKKQTLLPCLCCDYYAVYNYYHEFEVCPICGWEDHFGICANNREEIIDYYFADDGPAGPNKYNLAKSREVFQWLGACSKVMIESVWAPQDNQIPPSGHPEHSPYKDRDYIPGEKLINQPFFKDGKIV